MHAVIRISGVSGREANVGTSQTPEGARRLADRLKNGQPKGSSNTYKVVPA